MALSHEKPAISSGRAWLMASRPMTLPAAVVPVFVGTTAAWTKGAFHPLAFVAALIASLLIQVGTNLANDLFDFKKGADTEARLGPTRVTQAGLLTAKQVARGTFITFALAFVVGLYLVAVGGWPILLVGLVSIAAGVMYTGGPYPLAYNGLGDLFSFIFFGVVAVMGTYFLHTGQVDALAFVSSIPVGLLVTAILVVNNLRDIDTDKATGKRTMAVRLGRGPTRLQYTLFVALSYVIPLVLWQTKAIGAFFWLPWLTIPMAIGLVRRAWSLTGKPLNLVLRDTGRLHLFFGLLFALAMLL